MVIHANHPNEITASLGQALGDLRRRGTSLLNQAVLLKSVNDDADTLAELSESLREETLNDAAENKRFLSKQEYPNFFYSYEILNNNLPCIAPSPF